MKKQLIFALVLCTFTWTACVEETFTDTEGYKLSPVLPLALASMYPSSAACGAEVALFGENFGASVTDNFVAFNVEVAEVLEVGNGMILTRVPMLLSSGACSIAVTANGQTSVLEKNFMILEVG